ncbi:MAG TPA: HU family DNA-binding protein [Candidatus Aquabacterium excrementipullorum]|nr:HU family DNA-binding protein [Candidatus Aquabacterium excrementipullorum]
MTNKTDLVERLAEKHSLSKAEAGRVLETLLDTIVASVKKGDAVTIPGFGSFKLHARAARNGVNPSTGAKIKIAAAKLPKFTPGATFKAAVDAKAAARKAAKAPAAKPAKAAKPTKAAAKPVKAAAKPAAKPAKKAAAKKK